MQGDAKGDLARARAAVRKSSRGVLERCLDVIEEDIERRVDKGIDINGKPFKPLSPTYAKQKSKKFPGMPILKATRAMLAGANIRRRFKANQTGTTEASMSYTSEYAAYHQEGGGKLPKREFIGVSKEAERQVDNILDGWITGILRDGRATLRR